MQIVYLASSTIPSKGADAVHVMNVCRAFAKIGNEVILIARKSKLNHDPFEYYGIQKDLFKIIFVERPNIRLFGGFIYGFRVRREFNRLEAPDFIYARSIHALRRINPKTIPFFFESHWIPNNYFYYRWQKEFLKKDNLMAFVFISDGLKKLYVEKFSYSGKKFKVLHDACDRPTIEEKRYSDRLQIGYVGSFFQGNGYNLIPEFAKRMPECDFHIVGGSDPMLSNLKNLHSNLKNLVFWGHVPHKELKTFYAKFDLMIAPYQKSVPSLKWMSPMKLFEYMSYSKPIIVSDFPVIREVLDDSNCILVDSENIREWCDAIERLKSLELRAFFGHNAFKRFESKYTWEQRVKEILKLYTER